MIRRSDVLKVKVAAWISQHSGISQLSPLSMLIFFETGDCHHMPAPSSSSSSFFSSSNNFLFYLLFHVSSLHISLSTSSSGLLIVGGGGAWNSAEFWPELSCEPPPLPRTLDTPSLGLVGEQVCGKCNISKVPEHGEEWMLLGFQYSSFQVNKNLVHIRHL